MNFGEGDYVMTNTPAMLKAMAQIVQSLGVRPEIEVFDTGHLLLAKWLKDQGVIDDPVMVQLCMGIPWGAPDDIATLMSMVNNLPDDWVFSAFSISRNQLPYVAMAMLAGGNIRVGLEDNIWLDKGVLASNGQLVETRRHHRDRYGRTHPRSGCGARAPRPAQALVNPDVTRIERAACIGAGVIGAGWAARMIQNGIDVAIFDPAPGAQEALDAVMTNAEWAYERMAGAARPRPGTIRFVATIADAVRDAQFIQESVPERLDLKQKVLAEIDLHAMREAPIASSTSGLLPSAMQAGLRHPERVLVGHPFNPVYLLPLVELVGGELTTKETIYRARAIYAAMGMKPVHVRKEIDAFVGDRLQEALWREALWLVHDDIASVEELDDVIRYSFGLRWAQMGVFQTYRIAGGEAGMRHFMAQFGPALAWPWTKLMDVPELTDALIDKITAQSDAQADGLGIRELERIRDTNLIGIMEAMEGRAGDPGWGAGEIHTRYCAALADAASRAPREDRDPRGLAIHTARVVAEWIDYNGHMTEHRYVQVFGDATDAVLARMGCDAEYLAGGHSYFTVESHVRHLDEAAEGDALVVYTRVLRAEGKRLHLFHTLCAEQDGRDLATSEQLLLHVNTREGRACAAPPAHFGALDPLVEAAGDLPPPRAAGRRVGERA